MIKFFKRTQIVWLLMALMLMTGGIWCSETAVDLVMSIFTCVSVLVAIVMYFLSKRADKRLEKFLEEMNNGNKKTRLHIPKPTDFTNYKKQNHA